MNPFDPTLFPSGPVMPCCTCGCDLTMPTLLIDGSTTNYANVTDATAAIAAQAATGCLIEGAAPLGYGTRTTFTSSFTAGSFAAQSDISFAASGGPGGFASDTIVGRMFLTTTDGLSVIYSVSSSFGGIAVGGNYIVELYEDDQTTLVSDTGASSSPISGTFSPTISANAYYWLRASFTQSFIPDGTATSSITWTATGGTSIQPCSVRAAYDDGSGGTAYVICT